MSSSGVSAPISVLRWAREAIGTLFKRVHNLDKLFQEGADHGTSRPPGAGVPTRRVHLFLSELLPERSPHSLLNKDAPEFLPSRLHGEEGSDRREGPTSVTTRSLPFCHLPSVGTWHPLPPPLRRSRLAEDDTPDQASEHVPPSTDELIQYVTSGNYALLATIVSMHPSMASFLSSVFDAVLSQQQGLLNEKKTELEKTSNQMRQKLEELKSLQEYRSRASTLTEITALRSEGSEILSDAENMYASLTSDRKLLTAYMHGLQAEIRQRSEQLDSCTQLFDAVLASDVDLASSLARKAF